MYFFFFKQKTAYEMRISDWSSDVCSSDLRDQLEKELAFIAKRDYAPFFLTVEDIVREARDKKKILCQGRGSAANSAVCFVLGITAVDPTRHNRSEERREGDECVSKCRFRGSQRTKTKIY